VVQLQDLETQIYQTPTPTVPDPATTAVPDALNPLRRVVDKTKIVVDFVDNTMKVRPPYIRLSIWLSVLANILG